jgi:predicted metal-dependent RNase
LLAFVGNMQRRPQRTFLVHGEPPAQFALADALKAQYGLQVDVPDWKQQFDV